MKTKFIVHSSKFKKYVFLTFALCALQFAISNDAHAFLTVKANHDHITIDFFYHGSSVGVRGEADAGRDLVVKIASPEGHQVLKQKGKVGGLLWMNVGTLTFEHAPNLYEVFSTKKLDDMLSTDEQEKYVLGYPALAKHVEITPLANAEERTKWFSEFVKYKEASNLYVSSPGRIRTNEPDHGRQSYSIMTDWPYQAAPGSYTVTVYAVKSGKVVEQAETTVIVEQVGMVKSLAGMASNRAALYGFLSVGIALGAGFGVGMIFRKGGGSH